jgi:hypothetical protein
MDKARTAFASSRRVDIGFLILNPELIRAAYLARPDK